MNRRTLTRAAVSLVLLAAAAAGVRHYLRHPPGPTVPARAETTAVPHRGDAADDVAILVSPDDPARSLIVGTDKKGGIALYALDGRELEYLAEGPLNNVDLETGVVFPDGAVAPLVAASDNDHDALRFYRLETGADGSTPGLRALPGPLPPVGMDAEGVTLYRDRDDGRLYAFVVGEAAAEDDTYRFRQFAFDFDPSGAATLALVRDVEIGTKSESCLADDAAGHLYVSEENVGVWRYSAAPDGGDAREMICRVGYLDPLRHDVEGLAIHESARGRFLVVSSQGSDDYVVVALEAPPRTIGRFRVGPGAGVDGASETDGLDIASVAVGDDYPDGLLVVHDGANDDDSAPANQNYKLVSWRDVAEALDLDP